jgi:RNA polymerase sigma-32 factor
MSKAPANLPVRRPVMLPAPVGRTGGDLLQWYIAETRRHPILEADEERELALAYAKGDRKAGERLVCSNLRLVLKTAFRYQRRWENLLDLVQEGNLGLLEALKRFDPTRDVRFSSYAAWWIRAMIMRFLLENIGAVKVGGTRAGRRLFFQLQKETARLVNMGVEPTTRLLAERLDVSEEEVRRVEAARHGVSLDDRGPGGEGRTLSEMVPDTAAADPEDEAARGQIDERVRRILDQFATTLTNEREKTIWERHTIAMDPASLQQLGDEFGVSKERVRQIEARMRQRLKEHLTRELGDDVAVLPA